MNRPKLSTTMTSPRKKRTRLPVESVPQGAVAPAGSAEELEAIEAKLRAMPPQAGLFLIFTGTLGGLCIPGLPGFAISLLGGLIVAPRTRWVNKADDWLKVRAPVLRSEGLRFADRFFRDLNQRFPKSAP